MTKPEAEALKTYIDFLAEQTADYDLGKEIESKNLRDRELITESDTPNVSLKVFYNEAKNCAEVDLRAWQPLSAAEVQAIKDMITNRKETVRKPYPGPPAGSKVVASESTNETLFKNTFEEGGTIDRETFNKLKPFTFGMDYGKVGPLSDRTEWAVVGELSEEAKAAFRESVGRNFDRQYKGEPVPREFKKGPLVYGWQINHTVEDEAGRIISIEDLLTKFLDGKKAGDITPLFIEFAKLVRVLTIQETTEGISARLTVPDGRETYGAGNFNAVPWIDRRPDENIIKLPKDFTL